MRAMYSSSDRDQVDHLKKRFEVFKQQFDRGVSVQSAATLESVLNAISKKCLLVTCEWALTAPSLKYRPMMILFLRS